MTVIAWLSMARLLRTGGGPAQGEMMSGAIVVDLLIQMTSREDTRLADREVMKGLCGMENNKRMDCIKSRLSAESISAVEDPPCRPSRSKVCTNLV